MQEAGRILLMPKGDYAAGTSYEMLDLVNHGGASWVCKKACTGQEPSDSNTEFWQRFGTAVDMSNLNAKTLDGHEAEYFAPLAALTNYLPLTGGKIKANGNNTPLQLDNGDSNIESVLIELSANGKPMGHIGVLKPYEFVVRIIEDGTVSYKTLLHTGNKPTGTYTGNGDATERTIATSGIGNAVMVYSSYGTAIITTSGAVIITSSGNLSYTKDAYIENVCDIVLKTSNDVVNGSGTIRYSVL